MGNEGGNIAKTTSRKKQYKALHYKSITKKSTSYFFVVNRYVFVVNKKQKLPNMESFYKNLKLYLINT